MSSHQLDEERIFHFARELPDTEAQAEYLDQICAGDQALRERVEELLKVHREEQGFLKSNDQQVAATVDLSPGTERPGATIGRYKLMEQIGEGGMGTVFVAQQDRPIRRKVALKVIKPGMDTKSVVARFEAERQALAMMDHPNIAKVLDAGTTESGRPYFAMELVKGVPITDYCDRNRLSIKERLELFIQVCHAIQHAHQKGIIHRDIKSSNVLVTLHDGKPVPKVIDFGVAKALNARLTDKTIYTEHLQIVGTLLYMSPEQAELSGLDVDTRSDIYSLGVLLYELLTGTTPFQKDELDKAGFDEQRRIIRDKQPPRASVRISSMGETATAVAEQRKTDPKKLHQAVQGDLDWIVLKALEKDRTRRYAGTSAFAEDLDRYLDGLPVQACPPSASYRLRKFAKRHSVALGTMSIVATALLAATAASVWSLVAVSKALHEKEEVLRKLTTQVIERGINESFVPSAERVEETIAAHEAVIPDSWKLTLRGAAQLHLGENRSAMQLLEQAVEEDPANTSAKAMLAIAYFHVGELERYSRLVADFDQWKPRENYQDLDQLFLGYACIYMDYLEAADRLKAVLDQRPEWIVPQCLLAIAYAEHAQDSGDLDYVLKAHQCIAAPLHPSSRSPLTLMVGQFVNEVAMRMEVDLPNWDESSDEFVRELEKYPDYHAGTIMRAGYHDLVGNRDEALLAWRILLDDGKAFFQSRAMAEFFKEGNDQAVVDAIANDPYAEIGKAFVLAHMEQSQAAQEVLDRHLADAETWTLRYRLLQLMLILRDPRVRQQCRTWCDDQTVQGRENPDAIHRDLIEIVASGDKLAIDDQRHQYRDFATNYVLALRAYSEGNLDGALGYLEKCAASPGQSTEHHWARAFRERWKLERSAGSR